MLGEYELVESGVVIQIKDNPINITLPDEVEGDFTFIFTFSTDAAISQVSNKITSTDKFTLSIELINYDNNTRGGNSALIEVGTLRGIPLFINYRVMDLSNVSKTLTFNFYLKREVENGNK